MKQKKVSSRFLWADVIRVLAIFLVLAAHLSYLPQKIQFNGILFFTSFAVAKTCIPLFVMLSGALLLTKKETYRAFFSKRVARILRPWLAWSVIFLLLRPDQLMQIHDVNSFTKIFIGTMESFWFLPMILALYIITPALRFFIEAAQKKDVAYVIAILFFTVSFMPYHHNSLTFPLQVDDGILRQTVNFLGFYLLGNLLINIELPKKKLSFVGLAAFIAGLLWVIVSLFLKGGLTSDAIYLFDYISPGIILMSIGVFILVYLLMKNADIKFNNKTKVIISEIGGAAFGVYFVHGIVWQVFQNAFHFTVYPLQNGIFSTLLLFCVCLAVILLLQQVPVLKKFVS